MEDIKARLNKTNRIILGHSPMKDEGMDAEVVCLLIRKSLEQIAFASLVAHKDAYAAVHADFAKAWRVKQLLARLAAVHPDFFPKPVAFSMLDTGRGKHLVDVLDGFLTKEDFEFLYDTCSEVLHTWNPFRPGPFTLNSKRPFSEWVNRIQRLLDLHYIRLYEGASVWVVQMQHPETGRVTAWEAG